MIEPQISVIELKQRILNEFNKANLENVVMMEDIRLRNPKLDDLGEVINDCEVLENCHLYDEKEIYL